MDEQNETVADLATLIVAALAYDETSDETSSVHAAGRIAARLGIGEDDSRADVEDILRGALGPVVDEDRRGGT